MKVSIIMPVYNAATTVSRMIESIQGQTLADWELLAINDGSTDGSGIILDEYAATDSRIRVFHKQNNGVAMARQLGVDNATGKYSIHADSDDWIESTMLAEMYTKAIEDNADVVITDYYVNYSEGRQIFCKQEPENLDADFVLNAILKGELFGGLCHKLLRTSVYKRCNARFFEGINYCEDVLIWAQVLKNSDVKVAYLSQAYYHYEVLNDSITNNTNRESYETRVRYNEKLRQILPSNYFLDGLATSSLSVFHEGFVCNVLSDDEIRKEFHKLQSVAFKTKSIRWMLGYLMVKFGCYSIARVLLNYR